MLVLLGHVSVLDLAVCLCFRSLQKNKLQEVVFQIESVQDRKELFNLIVSHVKVQSLALVAASKE